MNKAEKELKEDYKSRIVNLCKHIAKLERELECTKQLLNETIEGFTSCLEVIAYDKHS